MNTYLLCIIGVFIISTICGFIFIPIILNYCKAKQLYDIPNARKIHKNAIPRLGGISFIPGMFISFMVAVSVIDAPDNFIRISLWSFFFPLGTLLIYGMGIVDDILGLSPSRKFIVQIIAACLLPFSGLCLNNMYGFLGIHEIPYYISFPLTVLVIVFIDNAINLIDGIDGLAASLSILALCGFLYLFLEQEVWSFSILITGLIGVLSAFLYFNIFGSAEKNRKIFMGDSGSLTLGFILGFLCVKYSMDNIHVMPYQKADFIMPFTLLLVPIFDVFRVFFVRISHHKSPFVADKNHIHHKLMSTGLSQHKALITILLLAVFFIVLNLLLLHAVRNTVVFFIDILVYITINLIINWLIRKHAAKAEA